MKGPGNDIILLSFLVLLWAGACAPSLTSTGTGDGRPAPAWVQRRPMDAAYYIGIATVAKRPGEDNYRVAKQLALEDMASEISVEVKSTTTHYVSETNRRYFEEQWQSLVRTKSLEHLRDYEPVDSWEDATHLWVYYRLSRADYEDWRAREKANALTSASEWIDQSAQAVANGQLHQAFNFLGKAREALLPFPEANREGVSLQSVDNRAIGLAGGLKLSARHIDNGPRWPGEPAALVLEATFRTENVEMPASGLKIVVRDALGTKRYGIPTNGEVNLSETASQIEVRYDFGEYLHLLPVLSNLRHSQQVAIPASQSAIYLKPAADTYSVRLTGEVSRALERAGFVLAPSPEKAEWIADLQIAWRQDVRYGMYTVWCSPSVVLSPVGGNGYPRQWDMNEAKGVHTSLSEARRLAAKEVEQRIKYQTYKGTSPSGDYSRGSN
ncbi:LPP20 family lipoprotein [Roseivirga sp. BDSF3-8]|uniref:LPP20 family lipoprotein n=1 Tax=Roseivirga sp. BDSF3-8 TaxID=3241598 RepID=UPI003531F9FD